MIKAFYHVWESPEPLSQSLNGWSKALAAGRAIQTIKTLITGRPVERGEGGE